MSGRFVYNSAIGAGLKDLFGHDGITIGPVTFVAGPKSGDGSFEVHEARHQQQWNAVTGAMLIVALLLFPLLRPAHPLFYWCVPFVTFWAAYYVELACRIVVLIGLDRPNPVQNAYLDLWAEVDARATAQQRRPVPR